MYSSSAIFPGSMEFLGRKGLNINGFVSAFASQNIQKKDEFKFDESWLFLSSCLKYLYMIWWNATKHSHETIHVSSRDSQFGSVDENLHPWWN